MEFKTLGDLVGLTNEQAREVLQKIGATFEAIPEVDLGNLSYPGNIHAPFYVSEGPVIHKKTEKGFEATLIGGFDPQWEIDSSLVVKSMNTEESLKAYANFLKKDFADMADDKLLKFSPMGRKYFARARDECLRRKLINRVGE